MDDKPPIIVEYEESGTSSEGWSELQRDYGRAKRLFQRMKPLGNLLGAIAVFVVLVTNIIVLIWSLTLNNTAKGDLITIFEGSCELMKTISTWTHLAINVVSTILLAASNSCMQILNAPSRAEIDAAHRKGTWFNIGVLSPRNFSLLPFRVRVLAFMLSISGATLHLCYNSIIIPSMARNSYRVYVGSQQVTNTSAWQPQFQDFFSTKRLFELLESPEGSTTYQVLQQLHQNMNSLRRLDKMECLRTYSSEYQTTYSNIILVTDAKRKPEDTILHSWSHNEHNGRRSMAWLCPSQHTPLHYASQVSTGHCDYSQVPSLLEKWQYKLPSDPEPVQVQYCLAQPSEHCTLKISKTLLTIIIISNAIKLACIVTSFFTWYSRPFLTVGDLIRSCLREPDPITAGSSRISDVDVRKWRKHFQKNCSSRSAQGFFIYNQKPGRSRWFQAVPRPLLLITFALLIISWSTALVLLWVYHGGTTGVQPISFRQFGKLSSQFLINSTEHEESSLLQSTLLANTPQVVISFCYLFYNNVITHMLLSREYARYAQKRLPLRVSFSREEHQRRSHRLTLPYPWAITLIITMAVLHWLASQSLFLADVTVRDSLGQPTPHVIGAILAPAWSPSAVIVFLVVSGCFILALFGLSFMTYPQGSTPAATCSLVVSAACHPDSWDKPASVDPSAMPLQYGAVDSWDDNYGTQMTKMSFSASEMGSITPGADVLFWVSAQDMLRRITENNDCSVCVALRISERDEQGRFWIPLSLWGASGLSTRADRTAIKE